jgi:sigma-B regulation protein RsbU (phosphoserine phosphatase)
MNNYFDESPFYYWTHTDNGAIRDVNTTLCRHLGFAKEDLQGKPVDTIYNLPTRIFNQTHFYPLLKMQGFAREIFITLQSKDKAAVPVLINAERKVYNDEILTIYAGILVENRKKYEDELVAAKKAAETALNQNTELVRAKQALQRNLEALDQQIHVVHKQNEELKQINHVVTHDLQEPLRKLSIFLNMMEEETDSASKERIVKKLVRVSRQMRSVVSGLQQYVWLGDTRLTPVAVDVNELLEQVQKELETEYPSVALVLKKETFPSLYADREQMRVLFYQLLSNAIRFRKEKHEARVLLSSNTLLLNLFRNIEGKYKYSDFFKIELQDDGIGFAPEFREQVFELFKKLHPTSGSGVGLAICKRIVNNHGGTININSVPGKGTVVTILFPQTENHPPVKHETASGEVTIKSAS